MPSNNRPLVSFVVLSYNFSRFLGECVSSILAQQGAHEFEIIVVDDASTDDSGALLDSFADPRIRIIRHARNQGHAATVNDGLAAARGEYVARIDGDDRYRPQFLDSVLPIFAAHPEVGLVYGDAAVVDERGAINTERSDTAHSGRDFKGNELVALLERNFICAPTIIARREAWLRALPAPQGLAFHDWYFTLTIAREWEFYYLDQVLADYRVHSGNMHTQIARNKSEEPSIFWMLDRIYGQPERSNELQTAKQRARRRVYGAHYLTLADKYFGFGLDADAQRCYARAMRYRPRLALNAGVVRRLTGTLLGRKRYEHSKSLVRSILAPLKRVRGS